MAVCNRCGKALTADEVGLYKKLIHRGAEEFSCITCLAAHFGCDEALLRKKIEQFRASGCQLFVPRE